MVHGTIQLKSKRLTLRPLKVSDAKAMLENWASDNEVTKYLRWSPHHQVKTVEDSLAKRQAKYKLSNYYDWGIVIQNSETLIGTISVVNSDNDIKMVEIGFVLGKKWWSNGYMKESIRLVINYLFRTQDINRIEAKHDVQNIRSQKVLLASGFIFEGILRKRGRNNTGVVDSAIYSILRDEFIFME